MDFMKKLRTRGGNEVRIYATDGGGDYPVHGAVLKYSEMSLGQRSFGNCSWISKSWTAEGRLYVNSTAEDDLVEVPQEQKYEVALAVYWNAGGKLSVLMRSGDVAREMAERDLAAIPVERRIGLVLIPITATPGKAPAVHLWNAKF